MTEGQVTVIEPSSLQPATYAEAQRYAELLAKSDMVPAQFKGKAGNCLIALQQAHKLGVDPLMMMQSMYVVHGMPGLYAKFVIALANAKGPFIGPLEFEHSGVGSKRQCRAYATVKATGKVCEAIVSMDMAEKEQWTKNPKWQSMPDQMLAYRSAAFLVRLYCPEVMLGMQTVEEVQDIKIVQAVEKAAPSPKSLNPSPEPTAQGESKPEAPKVAQKTGFQVRVETELAELSAKGLGAFPAGWKAMRERIAKAVGEESVNMGLAINLAQEAYDALGGEPSEIS